jgi:uncharacterized BrkB/YihY/UPF0761 family membrane protein
MNGEHGVNGNDPAVGHSPGRHLVVLEAFAFIKGWFISVTLWVAGLFLIVAAQEVGSPALSESGGNHWLGLALLILMYGYGIALVFAAPLAWALGYLLRPVRNQWIHIAVFFAAPTLVFWTLGGMLGFGWAVETLGLWATVGAAAAFGRWAVRKQVELMPLPSCA